MKQRKILLVEDNDGDIVLTLKALKKADVQNDVEVVKDGEKALQFLKKEGAYKDAEAPGLILLDINLPKLNGKEVLAFIKSNKHLRTIPVAMLTTSNSENDIFESYDHHANCYISKPGNFNEFMDVIEVFKKFWMNIVKLPRMELYDKGN